VTPSAREFSAKEGAAAAAMNKAPPANNLALNVNEDIVAPPYHLMMKVR
jgi:hypothetical protein